MCTGAEAQMIASTAGSMGGGKQLGGMAPPPVTGGAAMPSFAGGAYNAQRPVQQGPPIEAVMGPPQSQQNEVVPSGQMGPPEALAGPANQTGFGGFFGNLDQNLQSPSKVIGMGLLNQVDPRLGAAGLLAGGVFGKNKLF